MFRLKVLRQFRDGLYGAREELYRITRNEEGAPRGVTVDGPQVDIPLQMIDWTLSYLEDFEWEHDIGERTMLRATSRRIVRKESAGVVAAITPWNVPIQVYLAKIITALAADCTAVTSTGRTPRSLVTDRAALGGGMGPEGFHEFLETKTIALGV